MSDLQHQTLQTDRTLSAAINLYYDLKVPDLLPAPLLLALHGVTAPASDTRCARGATHRASEFCVAALRAYQHLKDPKEPGGPLRFGFGWLTNFHPEESVAVHHRALLDLINTLVAAGVADSDRIFLLGFSQTCALNFRFAFTHPDKLRGVIGICGGLPGDWESSQVYQPTAASVFYLAGTKDEYYPPSRVVDYAERLRLRAANVQTKSYDAGHEIVPAMRDDLRSWLIGRS
jgi:phospholipase/carboxylesterase